MNFDIFGSSHVRTIYFIVLTLLCFIMRRAWFWNMAIMLTSTSTAGLSKPALNHVFTRDWTAFDILFISLVCVDHMPHSRRLTATSRVQRALSHKILTYQFCLLSHPRLLSHPPGYVTCTESSAQRYWHECWISDLEVNYLHRYDHGILRYAIILCLQSVLTRTGSLGRGLPQESGHRGFIRDLVNNLVTNAATGAVIQVKGFFRCYSHSHFVSSLHKWYFALILKPSKRCDSYTGYRSRGILSVKSMTPFSNFSLCSGHTEVLCATAKRSFLATLCGEYSGKCTHFFCSEGFFFCLFLVILLSSLLAN